MGHRRETERQRERQRQRQTDRQTENHATSKEIGKNEGKTSFKRERESEYLQRLSSHWRDVMLMSMVREAFVTSVT